MDLIEQIKKHGILGLVCVIVMVLNLRVTTLEKKLEDCWGDRIDDMRSTSKKKPIEKTRYYAILPSELKIKKDEKSV